MTLVLAVIVPSMCVLIGRWSRIALRIGTLAVRSRRTARQERSYVGRPSPEQNDLAMKLWRPARFFVFFGLVCYFLSKIIDALNKLEQGELGISIERRSQELVEGGSAIFVPVTYSSMQVFPNPLNLPLYAQLVSKHYLFNYLDYSPQYPTITACVVNYAKDLLSFHSAPYEPRHIIYRNILYFKPVNG